MKITFLIPPVLDGTSDVDRCFGCNYSVYFLPLLPVLYAATLLKREGLEVKILDFPAQKKSKGDFEAFLRQDSSDLYVFYTVFLSQQTDMLARELIRGLNKGCYFIFSGPQSTYSPEVFLDNSDTFCVRGEPEFVTRDLLNCLKSKSSLETVKGVSFLSEGRIIHNPSAEFITDIDTIPIPDRALLDHTPYYNPKLRTLPHTAVLTSRGCFGQCWYCVPNSLSYANELEFKKNMHRKPPPRIHSAERVIAEFKNIAECGFKSVSVIDDEFLWDEKRTIEICEGIKGLNLEWSCLCRPDKVTEGAVRAMKEAGCAYVDMGTESFDEEVLRAIRKDMTPQDTVKAVELLKKYDIQIELNVLFAATPKETKATIKKTLRALSRLNVDYVLFSIANPFPGTDFYEAAKKGGWLCYGDYVPVDSAKSAIISYPHLTKNELERLISYAYLSYYFNPRYLLKQLSKVRSFADLRNKISTVIKFLIKNFSSTK